LDFHVVGSFLQLEISFALRDFRVVQKSEMISNQNLGLIKLKLKLSFKVIDENVSTQLKN
jgi:hypothetical protein